ncbi:unnamed protein product [Leptosia nina]|uniref:Uncharacterized protein n=1 Tax=Leptosia nina TaxID=320188 RepID=A0AAV1JLI7_9NEOP
MQAAKYGLKYYVNEMKERARGVELPRDPALVRCCLHRQSGSRVIYAPHAILALMGLAKRPKIVRVRNGA